MQSECCKSVICVGYISDSHYACLDVSFMKGMSWHYELSESLTGEGSTLVTWMGKSSESEFQSWKKTNNLVLRESWPLAKQPNSNLLLWQPVVNVITCLVDVTHIVVMTSLLFFLFSTLCYLIMLSVYGPVQLKYYVLFCHQGHFFFFFFFFIP